MTPTQLRQLSQRRIWFEFYNSDTPERKIPTAEDLEKEEALIEVSNR